MDIQNTIKKGDLFAALQIAAEEYGVAIDDFVVENDDVNDTCIHKFVKLVYSTMFPEARCRKNHEGTVYMLVDTNFDIYKDKLEPQTKKLEEFGAGYDLEEDGVVFKYENGNAVKLYKMLSLVKKVKDIELEEQKKLVDDRKKGKANLKKKVAEQKLTKEEKLAQKFAEISEQRRRDVGD